MLPTLEHQQLVMLSLSLSYSYKTSPIDLDALIKSTNRRVCAKIRVISVTDLVSLVYAAARQQLLDVKYITFLLTEITARVEELPVDSFARLLFALCSHAEKFGDFFTFLLQEFPIQKCPLTELPKFGAMLMSLEPAVKLQMQEECNAVIRRILIGRKLKHSTILQVPLYFAIGDILKVSTLNLWLECLSERKELFSDAGESQDAGDREDAIDPLLRCRAVMTAKLLAVHFEATANVLSSTAQAFLKSAEQFPMFIPEDRDVLFSSQLPGVLDFSKTSGYKKLRNAMRLNGLLPFLQPATVGPFYLTRANEKKKFCVLLDDAPGFEPQIVPMRKIRKEFLINQGWDVLSVTMDELQTRESEVVANVWKRFGEGWRQ